MGFLDKQSRVIDIVLTERGRKLYSYGQLDFTYFGLFDDGIDYNPWSSGTLTSEEIETQVESTQVLEAPLIRDVRCATAPLEPTSHLFTASAGYQIVPHMDSPNDGDQINLLANQLKGNGVYIRVGTNVPQTKLSVTGGSSNDQPGFILRMFVSGSNGLTAVDLRKDLQGRRCYDSFLSISIDSEVPIDSKTNSPRAIKKISGRKA